MWPKFFIASVALLVAGCSNNGDPIHVVVPDGFEGVIQIVVDGKGGSGYAYVNGRHEYTIPPNGVLPVKSGSPFESWHGTSASYAGGGVAVGVKELGCSVSNDGPPVFWLAVGSRDFLARAKMDP